MKPCQCSVRMTGVSGQGTAASVMPTSGRFVERDLIFDAFEYSHDRSVSSASVTLKSKLDATVHYLL